MLRSQAGTIKKNASLLVCYITGAAIAAIAVGVLNFN